MAAAAVAGKSLLQWSRDFSVAEGVGGRPGFNPHDQLQWSRDFSVAEGAWQTFSRDPFGRFNGAATLVSRKVLGLITAYEVFAQLQWSRDFSVAEGAKCPAHWPARGLLQWSRDFSVAEGGKGVPRPADRNPASMEPRL